MATAFTSTSISDDERRWTVIGVCLTKVLAPALRNVLATEIPKWHQVLCQPPTEIDKQVYGAHKIQLNPSTLDLKYKNINNNHTLRSPRAFHYAVKDPLSLAKLFVQPFMSKFTGFDETMDLSAVLSVICEAAPFVGAAAHAKTVRSDIRNEWAHCNFASWTESKFIATFQSMETLLKNVNLSPADEQELCDELHSWKGKGLQLCFGQPVDVEILSSLRSEVDEVRQAVQTWMLKKNQMTTLLSNISEIQSTLNEEMDDLRMRVNKCEILAANNTLKIQKHTTELSRYYIKEEEKIPYVFTAPSRNRYFAGRNKEIQELKRILKVEETWNEKKVRVAAVCGLGEIGKTSLVSEYAHQMKDFYKGGVYWFSAEDDTFLEKTVNDVALKIDALLGSFDLTLSNTLKKISSSRDPCLIVLDCLDQLDLSSNMMKFLSFPAQENILGHFIVLTRRTPNLLVNEVSVFEEDYCLQLKYVVTSRKKKTVKEKPARMATDDSNDEFEDAFEEEEYRRAYSQALQEGEAKNNRIPIMLIGQGRSGKTSLMKRLLGLPFNKYEPSTTGIDVDVIELTEQNAEDPWKKSELQKFMTSESEAKTVLYKKTAEYIDTGDQMNLEELVKPVNRRELLGEEEISKIKSQRSTEHDQETEYLHTRVQRNLEGDVPEPLKPVMPVKPLPVKPLSRKEISEIESHRSTEHDQKDVLRIFVSDFAGQSIYYDTHGCFVKPHCPCVLVHDASLEFDKPAVPRFKAGDEKEEEEMNNPHLNTNLDHFTSWLKFLRGLGECQDQQFLDKSRHCTTAKGENFELPPVLIALTNSDKVKGNDVQNRIKKIWYEGKYKNVVPEFFLIDNTLEGDKGDDVRKLRRKLFDLSNAVLNQEILMPVKWLNFEVALSRKLSPYCKYIPVDEAKQEAEVCGVEFDQAIKFLHRQGVVVHHSGSSKVVLDPPWLMKRFTKVISMPGKLDALSSYFLGVFKQKGILFQEYLETLEDAELLEELMQKFNLICPCQHEGKNAFYVPSVAPVTIPGKELEVSKNVPSLFVTFPRKLVPISLFTKLQVKLISEWERRFPIQLVKPSFYCNYSLLPLIIEGDLYDVRLIDFHEFIKVAVLPKQDGNHFKFASHLLATLKKCLDDLKSPDQLLFSMTSYDLEVECTCCFGKEERKCSRHHEIQCLSDRCGHRHFWKLSELQDSVCPFVVCRSNKDSSKPFYIKNVNFWLNTVPDAAMVEDSSNFRWPNETSSEASSSGSQSTGDSYRKGSMNARLVNCAGTSTWIRIGDRIKRNTFTLRVRNQHHTQTNDHFARVREEDSTPCMKEFDGTVFQEMEDSGVNPLMFQIEIERSGETTCNSNGLNLQLTFHTEVDQNMNYVILQQEAGSTQWRDITDKFTTTHGSRNIEIPVKKSSKIWVFRIKKSLSSLKHALLALIHGQVLFHILVYFLKKGRKIKLRIIGISEQLYQNPKGLKTAVTMAEEDKFLKGGDTEPPEKLLKKGSLTLECCKNSECVCLGKFDLGRNDIDKHAEWYKYTFDENDVTDNLEVKVSDKDGNVLWCIDLNEILCDEVKDVVEGPVEPRIEQPVNIKPDTIGPQKPTRKRKKKPGSSSCTNLRPMSSIESPMSNKVPRLKKRGKSVDMITLKNKDDDEPTYTDNIGSQKPTQESKKSSKESHMCSSCASSETPLSSDRDIWPIDKIEIGCFQQICKLLDLAEKSKEPLVSALGCFDQTTAACIEKTYGQKGGLGTAKEVLGTWGSRNQENNVGALKKILKDTMQRDDVVVEIEKWEKLSVCHGCGIKLNKLQ